MVAQKILLTGASGYLGSHVLDVLLNQGYHVRITARSKDKADKLIARYPQFTAQLDSVVVPDFTASNAYDNALQGVTAIIHVASPLSTPTAKDFEKEIINPAIEGTVNILKAAAATKSVARVVITSSIAAVRMGGGAGVLTEKDWNPVTREEAAKGPAFAAYIGSKKFAEKAVWDYVANEKPHFDVSTICPPFIYGPLVHPIESAEDVAGSPALLYTLVEHKSNLDTHKMADAYVDVRDVALAHVLALEKPIAANQRYIVSAGNYSYQEVADIVNKRFPGKTAIETGTPGVYAPPNVHIDTSKVQTQLGLVYHSKESTINDFIAQVVEFKSKGGVIPYLNVV